MTRITGFMRAPAGRMLRGTIGVALLVSGAAQGSLAGLVMMMVGLLPLVTALANVCLFDEFARWPGARPAPGEPARQRAA